MPPIDLTVAICTRNRPADLARTLTALAGQRDVEHVDWELLVVDDGDPTSGTRDVATQFSDAISCRYHLKTAADRPGLFASRLKALEFARGAIVLFLDDDAVPDDDYFSTLLELASANPSHSAFGGVDRNDLPASASAAAFAYARLFLLAGNGPGRLGRSGYNHAQMTWRSQVAPFNSDFLHGCNMAFRRDALAGLPDLEWLQGHSCCEDLVLSRHAARSGPILVSPHLRVSHFPGKGGRGGNAERLFNALLNHARFHATLSSPSTVVHAWSMTGLLVKDLLVARGKRSLSPFEILGIYAKSLSPCLSAIASASRRIVEAPSNERSRTIREGVPAKPGHD